MTCRRPIVAIVASSVMIGVVTGCGGGRSVPPPAPVPADLRVVSHWHSKSEAEPIKIVSGALAADPERGFVLFEQGKRQPSFFTTSERSGPLRLIEAGPNNWVFSASDGALSAVSADPYDVNYYELGRRLDPAHLPRMTQHGVAVPIVYGPRHQEAVMLVGLGLESSATPLYGYLAGFQLPRAASIGEILKRPLLGPHRVLYRIDGRTRRLVPTGHGVPAVFREPGPSCSTWPQSDGSRYVACPGSIVQTSSAGITRTLFKQPPNNLVSWPFLEPSPHGKTLLVEEDFSSCGAHQFTEFLPVGSGILVPANGGGESQPLGWLPFIWAGGEEALVAGLGGGSEECGSAADGIYDDLFAPEAASELIAATNVGDATTW